MLPARAQISGRKPLQPIIGQNIVNNIDVIRCLPALKACIGAKKSMLLSKAKMFYIGTFRTRFICRPQKIVGHSRDILCMR